MAIEENKQRASLLSLLYVTISVWSPVAEDSPRPVTNLEPLCTYVFSVGIIRSCTALPRKPPTTATTPTTIFR
jgi:hypothetical protein